MRSNVQQLSREMAPLAIPHIHMRAPCTTTTTTTIGVEICPPARSPAAKGGRARRRLVRGNSKGDGGNFTAARIARCILKSTAVPHPDPGTRALPRRTTTAPESCSRIRLRRLLPCRGSVRRRREVEYLLTRRVAISLSLSLSLSLFLFCAHHFIPAFLFPFLFLLIKKKLLNKLRGSSEQRAAIVSFRFGKSARFERAPD